MTLARHIWAVGALLLFAVGPGCGRSQTERNQERARLEMEEKARRETEAGNKAISGMNQKLGRKPPDLDIGVPASAKPPATVKKP